MIILFVSLYYVTRTPAKESALYRSHDTDRHLSSILHYHWREFLWRIGMLTFSYFWKMLNYYENDARKRKRNENEVIIFIKLANSLTIVNDVPLLTIVNDDHLWTIVKDDPLLTIVKDDPSSTIVNDDPSSTIVNDDPSSRIVNEERSREETAL